MSSRPDGLANTDHAAPNNYYDSDKSILLMNVVHWLSGCSPANEAPAISSLTHTPASTIDANPFKASFRGLMKEIVPSLKSAVYQCKKYTIQLLSS